MKILRLLTPARFLIGSVLMMLVFSPAAFAQTNSLTLAIKATPDPVQPGQVINYVFTCANSGPTAIDEVQVSYLQPNYTLGAFSQAPGYTQTATLYNLLPGQSQQVASALTVFPSDGSQGAPPPDGTVIEINASAAALDSSGNPTGVSTSTTSDVVVAVTPVFNLQMSSSDPDFVAPGASKTYTLRYSNPSSSSSDDTPVLVVSLPAGATYVSASNGGRLAADGTVQWAIAPLLPGTEGQRSFTFSVDGSTAAGTLLVTTASIQDGSATSRSARASSTNVVRTADGLSLAVKATPDPVQPGQVIDYVITCTNTGTTAVDEATVSYLQPNGTLGAFSQAPGFLQTAILYNILPGQSQQVASSLTVPAVGAAQGTSPAAGTLIHLDVNAAALGSDGNPSGLSVSTTSDVSVAASPGFDLQMSPGDPDSVAPGATQTFVVYYGNPSATAGSGVTLAATLPLGTTFVSATGGTLAADGVTVQWPLGALAAGASGQDSFTFAVDASAEAGTLLVADAIIQDGSATSRSARARATNVVSATPGLTLSITAKPDPVQPGQVIDYVITCTNASATEISEAKVSYLQPNGTLGAFSQAPGFLQTAILYNILPGQSQQVTSSLTVPAVGAAQGTSPAAGTLIHLDVNAAALGSDGNPSGLSVSTTSDVAVVSPPPAFFTGEISLGSGVYYLAFSDGNFFGYYSFLTDPAYIYHFDLGYEYVFDAADGNAGVYFYDFASSTFFYTSPVFPFPYLYDFTLNTVLYYYPDPTRDGHYSSAPRYFYDFATGTIITK